MSGMKTCSRCETSKELAAFHRDKKRKDGLTPHCKECEKKSYQANREKKLAYQRQYNEEKKQEISEKKKRWYQDNKDLASERMRVYREHAKPFVYAIRLKHNARAIYYGSTKKPAKTRWADHIYDMQSNPKVQKYPIYKVLNRIGLDKVYFDPMAYFDDIAKAREVEKLLIETQPKLLNITHNPNRGRQNQRKET